MQHNHSPNDQRTEVTATKAPGKSLVIISGKASRKPHFGDLWQMASAAGFSVFEGCWDSDNAVPSVRAFESGHVCVALVGPMPRIDGVPLCRLFGTQGFRVVTVAVPEATPIPDDVEPAAWVVGAASSPTCQAKVPEGFVARLDVFNPTAILRALGVGP